jgi:hypothetical protein
LTIQHKDIPDANRHEPKGASSAVANSVYSANGSGSGTWQKVLSNNLNGIAGDSGNANQKIVTNGAGGFQLRRDAVYGVMGISNNTNAFAVSAAADATLNTNTDYALFSGTGAPWVFEVNNEVTFSVDRMIFPVTGVYEVQAWGNITQYPTNTAFVGLKYRLNGTTFSARKQKTKSNSAGDSGVVSAFALFQANAGDFIQLYVASTAAGNLIIQDFNTTIKLLRQTA